MCEVEAIMNGRPIAKVSDDARDPNALTPNHLLLAQSNPIFPPGVFTRSDVYSKRRWRQIQYLTDIFWKRWTREYLPLLYICCMLLVDYSSPRNYWPMGRVLNVFPDKKGLVRSVRIQTKSSVFERPIDKLVLVLEAD